MRLDLRKIIEMPGSSLSFECELSEDNLDFPQVSAYESAPFAQGRVYNEAGVLHLEGSVTAEMLCICDRCGAEFESEKITEVDVILVEEDSGDDPNLYLIENGEVDVSEIMATCFILDMETKFLCREDCEGLQSSAPQNEVDPRFAVLQQLISQEE